MTIDSNNRARICINEEEIHDVCEITLHAEPFVYNIVITQNARNDKGEFEDDMIKKVTTEYQMGTLAK